MGQIGEIALKTADNNILTTPGNNPLQENYQFGKAIGSHTSFLNAFVQIGNFNASLLTFNVWVNFKATSANTHTAGLFSLFQNNGNATQFVYYYDNGNFLVQDGVGTILSIYQGFAFRGANFFTVEFNAGMINLYMNNKFMSSTTLASASNVDHVELGNCIVAFNTNAYGYDNFFTYASWYKRLMSQPEKDFMFNNKSGRFPLIPSRTDGMVNCENAQVLDFSALQDGSDMAVGFPAVIGNTHGRILNIPAAATLQAKADYVNSTYLESFI